jgi:hypothetical protein
MDDIGFGAGSAYLQIDVIPFKLAQLKLQFRQIRGLAGQELCVSCLGRRMVLGQRIKIGRVRLAREMMLQKNK